MKITKMLKLALSALLLAAGTTAFAAGEGETTTGPVRLKDGTTRITWEQFVTSLNGGIKGVVDEGSQVYKDWSDAKQAYDDAVTRNTRAKTALDNAKARVSTAQSAQTAAAAKLIKPEKNYKDAQDTLGVWQGKRTEAQGLLQTAQGKLSTALAGAGTETVVASWLWNQFVNAQDFDGAVVDYIFDKVEKDLKIYYQIVSGRLVVSFVAATQQDGMQAATAKQFYTDVISSNTVTINSVYVYLGDDYKNPTSGQTISSGRYTISFSGNKDTLLSSIITGLQSLVNGGTYSTTVPKETQAVTTARGEVTTCQNGYDYWDNKIKGYTETLKAPSAWATEMGMSEEDLPANWGDFPETMTKQNFLKKLYDDALAAATEATTELTNAEKALTAATAEETAASTGLTNATNRLAQAQTALDNAQKTADEAAAQNYQEIHLLDDINVTTAITTAYTGTIYGDGHIINNDITAAQGAQTQIFRSFTGQLNNAAINGAFASSTNGAKFDLVAYWPGTKRADGTFEEGVYYDATGGRSTYSQLGALGHAARAYFGVDFTANNNNGELVDLAANSKVYSITINQTNSNTQKYVTIVNTDEFIGDGGATVTIPTNRFAQCTDDASNLGLTNVYYGANNVCENVVIKDYVNNNGTNVYQTFYAPVQIKAQKVSFGRSFKAGLNTACLPFVLSTSDNSAIDYVCRYEMEGTSKFWFTKVYESIPANTPVLFRAKSAIASLVFDNTGKDVDDYTVIDQTPATQVVKVAASEGNSVAAGTYKLMNRNEVFGEQYADYVYGYSNGAFYPAAVGAQFPSFRMVIRSENPANSVQALSNERSSAVRGIGILDEDGNDITDELFGEGDGDHSGVESAVEDALSIVGGQGEISITAQADYGKVAIYTIDGRVVAQPTVAAGTTTVNVSKGLYIVLGKKVIVD